MRRRVTDRIQIARGAFSNGYIREKYGSYLAAQPSSDRGAADDLIIAYLQYRISRLMRIFLLSASNDLESLRSFLESVIRQIFRIAIARSREEHRVSGEIRVSMKLDHQHYAIASTQCSQIGRRKGGSLSRDMILGRVSAESVPRLDVKIELPAAQLQRIREHPAVMGYLMMTFERVVPVNLDYRVGFNVREEDCSFRLTSLRGSRAGEGGSKPLLGITSVLGIG